LGGHYRYPHMTLLRIQGLRQSGGAIAGAGNRASTGKGPRLAREVKVSTRSVTGMVSLPDRR